MNKLTFKYIIILFACLSLCNCKQEDTMDYALDDRVYFYETTISNTLTTVLTERNYSFALQNATLMEDTVKITVKRMGHLAD